MRAGVGMSGEDCDGNRSSPGFFGILVCAEGVRLSWRACGVGEGIC